MNLEPLILDPGLPLIHCIISSELLSFSKIKDPGIPRYSSRLRFLADEYRKNGVSSNGVREEGERERAIRGPGF